MIPQQIEIQTSCSEGAAGEAGRAGVDDGLELRPRGLASWQVARQRIWFCEPPFAHVARVCGRMREEFLLRSSNSGGAPAFHW